MPLRRRRPELSTGEKYITTRKALSCAIRLVVPSGVYSKYATPGVFERVRLIKRQTL